MEKKTTASSQNDKKLIFLGLASIVILFLIYSRFESPGLTPDAINSIERIAVVFYVLIIISFGINNGSINSNITSIRYLSIIP